MPKPTLFLFLACLTALVIGCTSESSSTSVSGGPGGESGGNVKLTGSGASFPYPLYDRWFKEYSKSHDGVKIDYQAKGSGAGIKDFTNGTTDFGASDAAMTDEEIAASRQRRPIAADDRRRSGARL